MQRFSRALQRVQALPRNTLNGASIAAARRFSSDIKRDGENITVEVNEYKTHRMEPPSTTVTATKEELLSFFEMMYRMRRMEVSADVLYKAKQIRGFCHLYDGQEAVIVGMEAATTREDSIITSYRDHATHLARGGTVAEVMGELMGKRTGCSLGKGGSMHMYRREANFFGGQGIVGAQVPLGAGMALAHSYMKNDAIAVTIYGDGAANQGQIFESMNMAALWDLPCVFVCENNHYGMGTAEWRGAKSSAFYTRGDYIPGLRIDGMDVLAVKQGMAHARAHALQHGPVVLEMDTYRYHGHSMSDPGSTYRTRDEVAGIRKTRDPIEHVRRLLTESGLVEAQELRTLEQAVKKEVDAAVAESKVAANPEAHNLWEHVYVDGLDAQLRGVHRDSWFTAPKPR